MCRRTVLPVDLTIPGQDEDFPMDPILTSAIRDWVRIHSRIDPDQGLNESRGLIHLRQWLRRRLEPDPPISKREISWWYFFERKSTADFIARGEPANPRRLRWTDHHEVLLYNQLRQSGTRLPPLGKTPDGGPLPARNEDALLRLLMRKGAFEPEAGSHQEHWLRGASIRAIWTILREEGYVYDCLPGDRPCRGWNGWLGVKFDGAPFPIPI